MSLNQDCPPGKFRSYVFTFYPTKDRVFPGFKALGVRYGIYQPEKCPKTGRIHYQGYMAFKNPRSSKSLWKRLSKCYLRPAKHDGKARNYCKKIKSRADKFVEFGEMPSGPGRKKSKTDHLKVFRSILTECSRNPVSAAIFANSTHTDDPYVQQLDDVIRLCQLCTVDILSVEERYKEVMKTSILFQN